MADTPNGLASMTQARERRARRAMPPARHPVPAGTATGSEEAAGTLALEETVVVADTSAEDESDFSASAPSTSDSAPRAQAGLGEGSASPSRPTTLYLDDSHIEFLEEVHIAGLIRRPKVDISKSAVVRLALRRLQEDMSVEQIRDHLGAQPTDPTKTGRKRR